VVVSQAAASGTGFTASGMSLPMTLAAGQSRTVNVIYAPKTAGNAVGNLTVVSDATNSNVQVSLAGAATAPTTAGMITPTPTALSFGSVHLGSSKTQSETLKNSGGSAVTISNAAVTGTGFTLSGLNLPLTLSAGQSFTFAVIYTPAASGNTSGRITLSSNTSSVIPNITLSGSGAATGQLSVTPSSLSFGNVVVGTSKNLTATLRATGASVTVSSVGISSPEFVLTALPFPLTIAPGQSAALTIRFTPQTSGAASGNISLTTNASSSLVTGSLVGTGVAAPQHSVDLSWNPSSSTVVGYNIYRGSLSGGPYARLTSSPDSGTTFTDRGVQRGQTYFYVTTAVQQGGTESAFSNEVRAVIPTP
jgi:HYDIN/CFA65/VesB family protein/centrosomal CEP192-like protein